MHAVAERIRALVSGGTVPDDRRGDPDHGLGRRGESDGLAQSPEPLVDAADSALLAAKRAGKNRIVVARPPPTRRAGCLTSSLTFQEQDD